MKSLWLMAIAAMWGCSPSVGADPASEARQGAVVLTVDGDGYADSAQVFFFRRLAAGDSLVVRQVIHGIGSRPERFRFSLPAGSYSMFVFGNVSADRIVARPPYSSDSIRLEYGGGKMPPVIYYGRGQINAGADTAVVSALVLVTAQVRLSVNDVPADVVRVEAELRNTGTGVYVGAGFIGEMMSPDLRDSLTGLAAGGSYTMTFSCFPTVEEYGRSVLHLNAYDSIGKLKYSGDSAPFTAESRIRKLISCSFQQSTARNRIGGSEPNGKLIWSYDESGF